MKKIVLIVFIAILPGLIGGCFGQKTEETATTQESPAPNASPSPGAAPTPPFGQGGQPGTSSSPNIDIAGLIPSTPPSQVPVQKGRSDPFGLLPVQPIITIDPTKVPINPPPGNTTTTTAIIPQTSSPKTPSTSTSKAPQPSSSSTKPSKNPPQSPTAKVPSIPPPPPQPTEAMAVYVSGVVGLSTNPVAIIKAPGENVERAVTPGTFLANGQVLVKAIYPFSDSPLVILEQYGIEVTKKVGQAPIEAKAPETADPETPANSEQS